MQITFVNDFFPFCLLLIFFEFKHFVADFLLQNKYMLGKFKPGWGFVLPLSAHCAVHAAFTLGLLLTLGQSNLWPLAVFDFVSHFFIDRLKASPKLLGKWHPNDSKFWYALGLDQLLHHICAILIVYILMTRYF